MAAVEHPRYGQGAVYGSLAYDFNHPELYGGEEYSEPRSREQQTDADTRTRVRTRAKTAPRTKQGIAPFALAGGLVAAFLFVTAITAQVGLVKLSGESVALEAKAAELQDEQTRLQIAYESAFNLAEIEEYATTTLGMQKPSADQVTYIDTSAPNKAVILGGGEQDGFVDRTADFLSGISSYFR